VRQRIVINLDEPTGEGTRRDRRLGGKRRRWPRVLAIVALLLLLVVIVAAVGGFLGWRHYQSTPAYTLTLLIDAAQRNDLAEFEKRINDDEIAKNMVTAVSEKAAARYGYALNSSIRGQIDSLMPSLLPRLKVTVHDVVVKEIQEFAARSEPRPFIFLVVAVPSLMSVTTEGDLAKVKAPLSGRTIELTMQRDADRWKVTGINDDVVVQRVVDSVMKELPAIGSIDPSSLLLKKTPRKRAGRQR
jgi:nitrate reductase NapE component